MNPHDIWPPAPVLRGLRMAVVPHPLTFKTPAMTSRDTLTEKPTWFLVAEDEQGRIGIGECSLILGLSPETSDMAQAASTGWPRADAWMHWPFLRPALPFVLRWKRQHGT